MPTPYARPATLSPTQAAEIASRARKLLRAGRLTHRSYAVLDALLWSSRERGADSAVASYSRLQKLAHVARGTVAKAIAELTALGLIQRVKRRVLVLWHNGGRAWRQMSNAYRLIAAPRCEFTPQTDSQQTKILNLMEPTTREQREAAEALAERRRRVEEALREGRCNSAY
jgi:DNA-binding MarR family transcriptional regulator